MGVDEAAPTLPRRGTVSKLFGTKSKPGGTNSKSGGTKSKFKSLTFLRRIELYQRVTRTPTAFVTPKPSGGEGVDYVCWIGVEGLEDVPALFSGGGDDGPEAGEGAGAV